MPRDPSGNYTLPALGNPAVTNTPITIAWWNGTSTDMAATLTDSLSRTGLGGMLASFKLVDGSTSTPAFAFQNEANTGFYRPTSGEMDVVVGGTRLSRWTSVGFQESLDNGVTWVTPAYLNVAAQSMGATGALDFATGKLTVNGKAIPSATVSSTSSGAATQTGVGFFDVPNLTVTLTTHGNPIQVWLVSDNTSGTTSLSVDSAGSGTAGYRWVLDGTPIGINGTRLVNSTIPPGALNTIIPASAASHTIKLQMGVVSISGATARCNFCIMVAAEL